MIFGNLKDENRYKFLPRELTHCIEYAVKNDLANASNGKVELDGNDIFLNIMEFSTQHKEIKVWEAHEKYIDIHMVLRGKEKIAVNFTNNLNEISYDETNDFKVLEGTGGCIITLEPGDFLICYPEDAHIPGMKDNEEEFIKKATFKVRID